MRFETQLDTVVIAILIAGLLPLICAAISKRPYLYTLKSFINLK